MDTNSFYKKVKQLNSLIPLISLVATVIGFSVILSYSIDLNIKQNVLLYLDTRDYINLFAIALCTTIIAGYFLHLAILLIYKAAYSWFNKTIPGSPEALAAIFYIMIMVIIIAKWPNIIIKISNYGDYDAYLYSNKDLDSLLCAGLDLSKTPDGKGTITFSKEKLHVILTTKEYLFLSNGRLKQSFVLKKDGVYLVDKIICIENTPKVKTAPAIRKRPLAGC